MTQLLYFCLCCGSTYDNVSEVCPQKSFYPHDQQIHEAVLNFLVNNGWRPGQKLDLNMWKSAVYLAALNLYQDKATMELPENVKEFLKIVEAR